MLETTNTIKERIESYGLFFLPINIFSIGRMNYETRNEMTIVFKLETEGSIQLKEDD